MFGAYALGMGLVIVAVSLAVALAQTAVVTWLRRVGRIVPRLGGGLLVVDGVCGLLRLVRDRVLRDGALDDRVIGAGQSIQRWLADGVDLLGAGGMVAVVAVLLMLSGLLTWWLRRRNRGSAQDR